jgi:hypothetical protein
MTDVSFGRLTDLALNKAWKHEARDFTPWLADNIEQLSQEIGISIELIDTEVAVESFSADILARNTADESLVVIENQLDQTDHKHLGQIMTYLAGLDAHTAVWVAPEFRPAHLSAIKWLNEHTADNFSFFAVKARVVRIEDSPYAPVFEVVAKPDGWQRHLKKKTASRSSELSEQRKRYFAELQMRLGTQLGHLSKSCLLFPIALDDELSVFAVAKRDRVEVYVRSTEDFEFGDLRTQILKVAPDIEEKFRDIRETKWGGAMWTSTKCDLFNPDSWPETLDWHAEQITQYLAAFSAGNENQ